MTLFLTIAITHFIALLTPGVDFFLILKTLMQNRIHAAKSVCIGIACGNGIILLSIYLSLFLLGKIDMRILLYIKYVGALYLAYLAFQCFYASRFKSISDDYLSQSVTHSVETTHWKSLLLGLGSSLLNPKNIMFYSTLVILIYPQYNFVQNLSVSVWMVAVVLFWNLGIVKLLSLESYIIWLQRYIKYLYCLSGVCFLIFSIVLFVSN